MDVIKQSYLMHCPTKEMDGDRTQEDLAKQTLREVSEREFPGAKQKRWRDFVEALWVTHKEL